MTICVSRRSSGLKRIIFGLALYSLLTIGVLFAQDYKVDPQKSESLTTYLRQHRLPLVGAQVLTDSAGDRRIVLYGFVATSYGKNDAERKARTFVDGSTAGKPVPTVQNRIEIRPEIARMKSQTAPSAIDTAQESLDQVLNDIARYGVMMAPSDASPY